MINLKNIQQIYINENYPKKWDDLNWETPDICDPRYLYSIYQAMIDRNYLDRIKPTFKQDNLINKVHSDFFNFRNDVPFRFRYFQIIYAWVIGNMQFFLNPDGFERSVKFEDGKSILTTENMRFNDSEMSAILGYDYRELPKPFQPFPYYNKFLIGMKNAIHSMKWIYWPMVITGSSPSRSISYGGYDVNPDDPNDLYNFHDGSLAEAFNSNITNNYTIENTDNAIIYDGSLLKKCNILLSDLSCNFSFTVYIENNLGQKFRCPVYISIPLGNDSSSIYDGNYTYTYNPNYSFLMYE